MSLLTIIYSLTMYPMLALMYFLMRNEGTPKKKYFFGTNLEKEYRQSEEMQQITRQYKKQFNLWSLILAVIPVGFYFVPWISVEFTLWMFWLLVVCFYSMYLVAKANAQVKQIRVKNGWVEETEYNHSYAELKTVTVKDKMKLKKFMPIIILGILPIIPACIRFIGSGFEAYMWIIILFALCTPLFYLAGLCTNKQKIPVICDDSNINMNYARAKKLAWEKFWFNNCIVNSLLTWTILFTTWYDFNVMMVLVVGCILYGLIVIYFCIQLIRRLTRINDGYDKKRTYFDAVDDDSHWLWGIIYYNRNDKRTLIENRLGTGTSVNLATPAGAGFEAVGIVGILIIPLCCLWMLCLEFTPIQTMVKDDVIYCKHLSVEYELSLDEIEAYEVIYELPDMSKLSGTGMDNVLSGNYSVEGESSEVFLNPQNKTFVVLIIDGETYYLSGGTEEETTSLIEAIKQAFLNRD